MKKKLLLVMLMIATFFVNACSCDKFDINTYNSAVKNFENSTGFSYELTVTTNTEGKNIYLLEESTHKYRLTPTRVVENFWSKIKKYEISVDSYSGNSAPQKVYELNRYYKGDVGKFYTNEVSGNIDNKEVDDVTYEEKYDEYSIYHVNNVVPTFKTDFISDFDIVKDKNRDGYSVATFKASCPALVECTSEQVSYKVIIDRDFYFSSIEFTYNNVITEMYVENGETKSREIKQTVNYKYEFDKYNSEVEITFPSDLGNY